MVQNMKKYFVIILALLAACGPTSTSRYETTSTSRWATKTIEVHFMPQNKIDEKCKAIGGIQYHGDKFEACARTKPENANICEIYAAEPFNFDDSRKLETLGHETWHCFGATHK